MIAVVLFGVALFCALLYRFAIYAVPAYLGCSMGLWAFEHGAGIAAAGVALAVGGLSFSLGRFLVAKGHPVLRTVTLAFFALPAAYTGAVIVWQLSDTAIPSYVWRLTFAIVSGLAVGLATVAKVLVPMELSASRSP